MATTTTPKGEADKRIGAFFAPLSVTAQDTPIMTVRIRAGSFFNTDNVFTEYAGGSTVAIAAPGTNARWTVVALTDAGNVALLHGASAISPSLPAIPAGHLPLAGVYVTSTTTAITDNLIIDLRPIIRATDVVADLDDQLSDRPTTTDMNNALALKADVDGTPSSDFVLNNDFVVGGPGTNATITVRRGDADDVMIRWNESTDKWELTANGTDFSAVALVTDGMFFPPVYTVGTLPVGVAGGMIFVSDATPAPAVAFYNGTNWINVVTGVTVV
jgi:hypothetical protein